MKTKFPLLSLVFLLCPVHSWAQYADTTTQAFGDNTASPGVEGSSVIRPRISCEYPDGESARYGCDPIYARMAARSGGVRKKHADALAQRVTFQTARFATGVITHEDPRYHPSSSHHLFARSFHVISFTVDGDGVGKYGRGTPRLCS